MQLGMYEHLRLLPLVNIVVNTGVMPYNIVCEMACLVRMSDNRNLDAEGNLHPAVLASQVVSLLWPGCRKS